MATSVGKETNIPAEGAITQTTTGGSKPLHRFLRAEPKVVGVVMMLMGICLILFGIPLRLSSGESSADIYSSFWLGFLYFSCGVFYVLAERSPTKKIVTVTLALSIISILGTVVAGFFFIKYMTVHTDNRFYHMYFTNNSDLDNHLLQHDMSLHNLEAVFLFHSCIGIVILIVMTVFARMSLRSTQAQTIVVMRSLPSAE